VTFLLSIAQVLVYFVYLAKEHILRKYTGAKSASEHALGPSEVHGACEPLLGVKKQIDKRLFAIPAVLDGIENVLKNISLTMISGSIVQMLRSSATLYCALLAMFFLNKRLYRHHWTSFVAIALGLALIGLAYILTEDK